MIFNILLACLATFIVYLVFTIRSRGLNKYAGPFLASFSNFWRLWYALNGSQKQIYVDTHRKYGDIVRVGPNELSFADPAAIHDIYGPNGCQEKSESYSVPSFPHNGVLTDVLFSTRNIEWHDQQRRLLTPAFSMTTLIKYEPWVDNSIDIFLTQLRERYATHQDVEHKVNLMEWFAYFSLDAISEITFGERAGFLQLGSDIDDTLANGRKMMSTWHLLSRMTILDKLTGKNPILLWFKRHGMFNGPLPFQPIVYRQFFERQEHWKSLSGRPDDRETLTDKFLLAQNEHPEVASFQPLVHSMSVVGAASESTAIALSSIFYFLLRNPRCYAKLQKEIDSLKVDAKIVSIPYSKTQNLSYLDAVISESMRCHWSPRVTMARITPPEGKAICGEWISGGVEVGVWGSAIHHHKPTFGEDVDVFRPERWLENEEKTKRMKSASIVFGSGKYGCLGKNLARMEMYKVVPSLMRAFEFSLVKPNEDWVLDHGAFAAPRNLLVTLRARREISFGTA